LRRSEKNSTTNFMGVRCSLVRQKMMMRKTDDCRGASQEQNAGGGSDLSLCPTRKDPEKKPFKAAHCKEEGLDAEGFKARTVRKCAAVPVSGGVG
jgi:hypothetical protein